MIADQRICFLDGGGDVREAGFGAPGSALPEAGESVELALGIEYPAFGLGVGALGVS